MTSMRRGMRSMRVGLARVAAPHTGPRMMASWETNLLTL